MNNWTKFLGLLLVLCFLGGGADNFAQNREEWVELFPNQVCLYGHWLSGRTLVCLSEDRVFVGGIRVHPNLPSYNDPHQPWESLQFLKSILFDECRYQERELAVRGQSLENIRKQTLDMLVGLPVVKGAKLSPDSVIEIESHGGEFSIQLPNPIDQEEYFSHQKQSFPAEKVYTGWVNLLNSPEHPTYVFMTTHVRAMRLRSGAAAMEIQQFLDTARPNEWGGLDWPPGLGMLLPSLEESIVRPEKVWRL